MSFDIFTFKKHTDIFLLCQLLIYSNNRRRILIFKEFRYDSKFKSLQKSIFWKLFVRFFSNNIYNNTNWHVPWTNNNQKSQWYDTRHKRARHDRWYGTHKQTSLLAKWNTAQVKRGNHRRSERWIPYNNWQIFMILYEHLFYRLFGVLSIQRWMPTMKIPWRYAVPTIWWKFFVALDINH